MAWFISWKSAIGVSPDARWMVLFDLVFVFDVAVDPQDGEAWFVACPHVVLFEKGHGQPVVGVAHLGATPALCDPVFQPFVERHGG